MKEMAKKNIPLRKKAKNYKKLGGKLRKNAAKFAERRKKVSLIIFFSL